ncbi:hypothetical protein FGG08_003685 [Glutinoglossum americanum]|uniref:CMP/dCMP-type deaminase domain-containing protein n=1 Tax=Glutinoglossum americanum TaxID=1670608 RepID=A0A9P8I261_9PEZI|nr:hypothetical protein FGG08_003685 [Glutinoglossum americanum]
MKSSGYSEELASLPPEAPSIVKQGCLAHLKTCLEVRAREDVIDVYIVDIPARCANGLLKKENISNSYKSPVGPIAPDRNRGSSSERGGSSQAILSMLVTPTRSISHQNLMDCLLTFPPLLELEGPPVLLVIPVPLLPPSTARQAERWSQRYWPTIYRSSNPYGPHLSIVSRAERDLTRKVGHFMSLAAQAGGQAKAHGFGHAVGAVIVDGMSAESDSLTIVAGDARWRSSGTSLTGCEGNGNVMGHAVMRAIGMVARKRVHSSPKSEHVPFNGDKDTRLTLPQSMETATNAFLEQPLTPIENTYYWQSSVSGDGYLCIDLDIYTTHEPCIMCSMAALHSRFRGIVFGRRMVRTGGLTAEVADNSPRRDLPTELRENGLRASLDSELGGLGYGMFWRDELNWKLLAWQWENQGGPSIPELDQNTHV